MAVATYTDNTLPATQRAALPSAADVVAAQARPVEIGTRPSALAEFLASRDQQIRRLQATFAPAPEIPANLRLTGLRGVAKTVTPLRFGGVT